MSHQSIAIPWDHPDWLDESQVWIQDNLDQLGLILNGAIEQAHTRPWSTVLRVPTNEGNLFFKASAPSMIHEAGLTQALASWRPDRLPKVLAADRQRSWLLLADGGRTLRSYLGSDQFLAHWRRILPLYAEMQIEMAGRRDDLLALGAMDRRLEMLPAKLEALLTDQEALLIDQPDGLSAEQFRYLGIFVPRFAGLCAFLDSFGLPETLQHDDFHGNNIFVGEDGYLFFDWGETCVAHPFFTMVVTPRGIAYHMKLAEDAPELAELRDIYLEPWRAGLDRRDLDLVYDLANLVGRVNRALTWYRIVADLPEPYKSEEADAVPGWLLEFLEAQAESPF